MSWIGNHVSTSHGWAAMAEHEADLGGDTFAFFPRNPRGGQSRAPEPPDVEALQALLDEHAFGPLVVHGAYTMNLCSAKPETRANAREMLRDDLVKLQALPGHFYNFHPGSHVGQGPEAGIVLVAAGLVEALHEAEDTLGEPVATTVLLETMAGKGSEVGGRFEELRAILDAVEETDANLMPRLGVCLDTCHVWDAGYDIAGDLDGVLAEFDRIIGLERLRAVHLNDSKNPCGSHKDRHETLGNGCIGEKALRAVVQHPSLQGRPFILETPNPDDAGFAAEIEQVHAWMC